MVMTDMLVDEIIAFSKRHPWRPRYSESKVRRFLTELASSSSLIFDLHDERGRVASAVLLDRVTNPSNDACLEVLGIRDDAPLESVATKILELAMAAVPSNRAGFQFSWPGQPALGSELVRHFGFLEHYDTYEMKVPLTGPVETAREAILATEADRDEVYDVLCEAFAANPDTSIPEERIWKSRFLKTPGSHFFVWKPGNGILGFANLIEADDARAEISIIGVLPRERGTGIGNKLLRHCLATAKSVGKTACQLTVAVQNQRALGLYLRAGFKTTEAFKCYRRPV